MIVTELIALPAKAPSDAVVVAHEGGHDADEMAASDIEVVAPADKQWRPFGIPDAATYVRIV